MPDAATFLTVDDVQQGHSVSEGPVDDGRRRGDANRGLPALERNQHR